jgi:hypothetical protein
MEAPHKGFVGAIIDSMKDGRDRIVLAWPSRPDNGFVAEAVALREARATGEVTHGTVALWPWRSGATYAARSILIHAEDICLTARRAFVELYQQPLRKHGMLAHESLCMVELRLNDLVRASRRGRDPSSRTADDLGDSAPCHDRAMPKAEPLATRNPTLLETTAVFVPSESPAPLAYSLNTDQVLRRMRRYTTIDTIPGRVAEVGDPLVTPFALMGLMPADQRELARCLAYERFITHGLDVVVVDLTRTARATLEPDWQRQLTALLTALDGATLPRRPPIVVLCEDAFAMRRADLAVRKHAEEARTGRRRPLEQGALLLKAGILEAFGSPAPPELPALRFLADVKDASLVPLRDRMIRLIRRLRDAGHGNAAIAVGRGLHTLSTFASLPVGIAEARNVARILFDGDGREEVQARSSFFPTSALQPMAEIDSAAPEFAAETRELLDEVKSRVCNWEQATPVSLKLAQLLGDSGWNASDVLLVLPDARTADVFLVSDSGVACKCTVIEASNLTDLTNTSDWRRVMVVRPESKVVRALLTMPTSPSRVLLLGDAAGTSLIAAELKPLASFPEFAPFAARAAALYAALERGGADETMDFAEVEFHYHIPTAEDVIDLTQAADGYRGEIVHFYLEGGGRATYRPGGDVLVFTPDEIRPFKRVVARSVVTDDNILVLREDIRERLSEALSRSSKTAAQLKQYHEEVVRFRQRLPGDTLTAKARHVLGAMRAIDTSIGDHEVPNIVRWLSVEPRDSPQQPRAARDQRRFSVFMEAAGIEKTFSNALWNFAIVPVRGYSSQEGHLFNKRIVQFVIDPEGVAAGAGWREYDGLWQTVVDSVDRVIHKETSNG